MYSNFITPPDFVRNDLHSILLVDPTEQEVTDCALICKNVGTDFNVYIYLEQYQDFEWLEQAFNLSKAVIINTASNNLSKVKDQMVTHPKSYYYGEKNFFDNNKRLSPMEYLINYVRDSSTKSYLDM
jgi:hypothetical protein